MINPYDDAETLSSIESVLKKNPASDQRRIYAEVQRYILAANKLGHIIPQGGRVLDVGCGIGDSVNALLDMGFDAFGVDVHELWGKEFNLFWEDRSKPTGDYLARLQVVSTERYILPYADSYFDFAISDQVFEHVFNYETVFSEVARVLKPGAISLHRFPGPNTHMEGHIFVPLPILCHHKSYLALWALMGRRSPRQKGMNWRDALASNVEVMKYAHYPSKKKLFAYAKAAGVKIEFVDDLALKMRVDGRVSRIIASMPSDSLENLVAKALSYVSQRYMIIYGS